jgi:hypothetical protein
VRERDRKWIGIVGLMEGLVAVIVVESAVPAAAEEEEEEGEEEVVDEEEEEEEEWPPNSILSGEAIILNIECMVRVLAC